jgi:putative tricarboxylic transport membrane protein
MINMSHRFNWDLASSVVLMLLGVAVVIHASGFPGAVRGVPGPAFFPMVIGGLLIALAVSLAATTRKGPRHDYWARPGSGAPRVVLRQIVAILILLVAYISLWDIVPFVARTPVMLVAIYRILGESWKRALLLAAILTVALYAVFNGLLSIQL